MTPCTSVTRALILLSLAPLAPGQHGSRSPQEKPRTFYIGGVLSSTATARAFTMEAQVRNTFFSKYNSIYDTSMEHLYFLFLNRGIQFVLHFRSSRLMWCGRPVKILPSPRYSSFFTVSDINCHYQCFKFNTHQSSRLLLCRRYK